MGEGEGDLFHRLVHPYYLCSTALYMSVNASASLQEKIVSLIESESNDHRMKARSVKEANEIVC